MDLSINQSYLCQQLIEINKKYESCTFVDIDFIDLFGLNKNNLDNSNIDFNIIKKKIVTKYYNLALKYHPDKYANNTETIINLKNCFINIDEIYVFFENFRLMKSKKNVFFYIYRLFLLSSTCP
jgi:hypothetical protein